MRTYQESARVFKALCDPKRLAILELLQSGATTQWREMRLCFTRADGFNTVWPILSHENSM